MTNFERKHDDETQEERQGFREKKPAVHGPIGETRKRVLKATKKPKKIRPGARQTPKQSRPTAPSSGTDRLPIFDDEETRRLPRHGEARQRKPQRPSRRVKPPSSRRLLTMAEEQLAELEAQGEVEFGPILYLIREAPNMARREKMFQKDDVTRLITVRDLIDETEQALAEIHRAGELAGANCKEELSISCQCALKAVILVINSKQGYQEQVNEKIKQLHIRKPETKDGRGQQV